MGALSSPKNLRTGFLAGDEVGVGGRRGGGGQGGGVFNFLG